MADIFLSYARKDAGRALVIRDALQAIGLSVFFDTEGLDGGDVFPDVLDREVKAAGAVVGVWSPYALTRPWVKTECDIGLTRGVLAPAAIERIEKLSVPASFWNVHFDDLSDFNGDLAHPGWRRLVRTLSRMLNRPDLLTPAETAAHAPKPATAQAAPAAAGPGKAERRSPLLIPGALAAATLAVVAVVAVLVMQPRKPAVAPEVASAPSASLTPPPPVLTIADDGAAASGATSDDSALPALTGLPGLTREVRSVVDAALLNARTGADDAAKARAAAERASKLAKEPHPAGGGFVVVADKARRFETQVDHGKRSGLGGMTILSGDQAGDDYWGEWAGGRMNGLGVYRHATNPANSNTISVASYFRDDVAGQSGRIEFRNGVYDGQIGGGRMHGSGVYRSKAKDMLYVGEYREGSITGLGAVWNYAGTTLKGAGRWEAGQLAAPG